MRFSSCPSFTSADRSCLQKTADWRTASSRASGYRSYSLDAGDEQSREVVLAAIWVFKSNLGNVAGCRHENRDVQRDTPDRPPCG